MPGGGIIFVSDEPAHQCRVLFGVTAGAAQIETQIELPGGRPEPNETPLQTAARESLEELGPGILGSVAVADIERAAHDAPVHLKTSVGEFMVWVVRAPPAMFDRAASAPATPEMSGFVAARLWDDVIPFIRGAKKEIAGRPVRERDAALLRIAEPAIWRAVWQNP